MHRIRGFLDLVFDVVDETNNLVERTHDDVVERSVRRFARFEPVITTAKVVTGIQGMIARTVFKSIRGINGITRVSVNTVVDVTEAALDQPLGSPRYQLATPMQSSAVGSVSWCIDYLQSALNGFWGDYLSKNHNVLATDMTLCHGGHMLRTAPEALAEAFPKATNKICVFVHSMAATEWLWNISSAEYYNGDPTVSFGSRLYEDQGFTPIYVRYNSGRHISDNGRDLSILLDELREAYPLPIEEIALVGHKMGG